MFPTGDGARVSLADMIQSQPGIFSGNPRLTPMRSRRMSTESVQSGLFDTQQAQAISEVKQRWWGNKRLGENILILCNKSFIILGIADYAVYCPEGIANFPSNSLPHLFHARLVSFVVCYQIPLASQNH